MREDYFAAQRQQARAPRSSLLGVFRSVQLILVVIAFVLCILAFRIVQAPLPSNMLDSSWAYIIDFAAIQKIPFGTDLVFTYGPLGLISSRFMLPDHQLLFTVVCICFITAFFWGLYGYTKGKRRYGLLLLPLLLANVDLSNAFFFTLPLVILYLSAKSGDDRAWTFPATVVLAALLGLTPLIKGTMSVPTIVCIGLATIIQLRKGQRRALVLPVVAAASTVAAWLCLGQPLGAIGPYFIHQIWIASGYTDAMSSFGDLREVRTFLIFACILLATLIIQRRQFDLAKAFACACVLFVSFKAGFVRHDAHAMISASGLVLVAFVSVVDRPTILRCIAGLACLAGAVSIESDYGPADLTFNWTRMTSSIQGSARAVTTLLREPGQFRANFEQAKQAIAARFKLPPTQGSVDLYSYDQTMILASNREYDPRPVIQSYSAYTPGLASLNDDHLRGENAPKTIFFAITPVDEQYPALEDGRSWPALLSLYKNRSFVSPGEGEEFAVLERTDDKTMAQIDAPTVSRTFKFDEDIPIPQD